MNEHIAELAEQAAEYAFVSECDESLQVDVGDKTYHIPANFIDVFAQLIVKECIKVVDETATGNQEINTGLVFASAAIVAHFGVEE